MNSSQVSINSYNQSNKFNRTLLDIMPEEIHQLIWKMVNKDVMESIILFGRYKTMFKLAITGPTGTRKCFHSFNNDKESRMPRISNTFSFNPILFDNGESCDSHTLWKIERWIYGENLELADIEVSACGLLNIKNISQLYQLCKHVDDNWEYLGFIENKSASKYTYNEHYHLDNALKSF